MTKEQFKTELKTKTTKLAKQIKTRLRFEENEWEKLTNALKAEWEKLHKTVFGKLRYWTPTEFINDKETGDNLEQLENTWNKAKTEGWSTNALVNVDGKIKYLAGTHLENTIRCMIFNKFDNAPKWFQIFGHDLYKKVVKENNLIDITEYKYVHTAFWDDSKLERYYTINRRFYNKEDMQKFEDYLKQILTHSFITYKIEKNKNYGNPFWDVEMMNWQKVAGQELKTQREKELNIKYGLQQSTRERDKSKRRNQYEPYSREYELIEKMKKIKREYDEELNEVLEELIHNDDYLPKVSSSIKSDLTLRLKKALNKLERAKIKTKKEVNNE